MQTTQQRYLALIEAAVAKHSHLSASIAFDYANTGRVHVHVGAEPVARLVIRFDFQTSRAMFSMQLAGVPIPSQPGRPDYFDFYTEYAKPQQPFWDALDGTLAALAEHTKPAGPKGRATR